MTIKTYLKPPPSEQKQCWYKLQIHHRHHPSKFSKFRVSNGCCGKLSHLGITNQQLPPTNHPHLPLPITTDADNAQLFANVVGKHGSDGEENKMGSLWVATNWTSGSRWCVVFKNLAIFQMIFRCVMCVLPILGRSFEMSLIVFVWRHTPLVCYIMRMQIYHIQTTFLRIACLMFGNSFQREWWFGWLWIPIKDERSCPKNKSM